ncbi:MAG TPA: hypothetical protein VGI40_03015 [Pirellulaceae bacterium]|jgi:hypothetical protein
MSVRSEFAFSNLPATWGVFVFVAVVAAVLYAVVAVYRREMSSCPSWVKNLLATLRCCTMLLLATIFLNPSIIDVASRTIEPTIVVARDQSASMSTADNYHDPDAARTTAAALGIDVAALRDQLPTRIELVNRLLAKSGSKLVAALEKKGSVEIYDFSDQPHWVTLDISADAPIPSLAATSHSTNLASAVEAGLKTQRPAAIILFTDGQHTTPDNCLESARHAKSRRIPLLLVGVGDPSRPKTERVRRVMAPTQAWPGEPFEIEAILSFQGVDSGSRRVELFEEQLNDSGQSSGAKLVAATEVSTPETGDGQATARFARTVEAAGRYVYRARIQNSERRQAAEDAATSDVVNVLSRQSLRVLLIAGSPTWDYRLVQTLLSRDKTISLSCWLQSLDPGRKQDGNRPIDAFPKTKAELFEYDVVLLFDPNPQGWDENWTELLSQFVSEHAGGVLFMAGPQFTTELLASASAAKLSALLPVKIGDLANLEIESLTAANQTAWPLRLFPANADHPALKFSPDRNENQRRWQSLPGVLWSLPAVDATPAAQILVEHTNPALAIAGKPRPLIIAGRYGAGNTLYLGFSGTWRWRSAGEQAEFFDKFWIQAVRFLVEGRSLAGRRRGYVQTDRERYEVGQRVNISARVLDASFQSLELPKIEATVEQPLKPPETVSLMPVGDHSGRYEAAITAQTTGITTVRLLIPEAGTKSDELTTNFLVELPSLEASQTWLNRPLLTRLASESGGRYFEVNEIDQLAAAVPNRVEKVEERSPPRPIWDTPAMLVALVGLLSTEWLLRKRFSLL